jgi:dCMP deaminase
MKKRKYQELYKDFAIRVADMSYAKRKQVGCVIVKDGRVISMGWNGMPSGFDNVCELGDGTTNPFVIHAEMNAIIKMSKSTDSCDDASLFVTLSPCVECAKLILQSGIKEVFYFEEYRCSKGVDLIQKFIPIAKI